MKKGKSKKRSSGLNTYNVKTKTVRARTKKAARNKVNITQKRK